MLNATTRTAAHPNNYTAIVITAQLPANHHLGGGLSQPTRGVLGGLGKWLGQTLWGTNDVIEHAKEARRAHVATISQRFNQYTTERDQVLRRMETINHSLASVSANGTVLTAEQQIGLDAQFKALGRSAHRLGIMVDRCKDVLEYYENIERDKRGRNRARATHIFGYGIRVLLTAGVLTANSFAGRDSDAAHALEIILAIATIVFFPSLAPANVAESESARREDDLLRDASDNVNGHDDDNHNDHIHFSASADLTMVASVPLSTAEIVSSASASLPGSATTTGLLLPVASTSRNLALPSPTPHKVIATTPVLDEELLQAAA